jgi:dTDP-glucose 4,6-dehydratase
LLNILHGKPLPIYGNGLQIRDWLYVDDHSRGIDLVINKGEPGETYNVGGNNEWTNIDVVKLLCQLVDGFFATDEELRVRFPLCPATKGKASTSLITYVTDRPGHDTRYAINAQKIMSQLGYEPKVGFADGLTRTVQWYLDNQQWWQKIQDGTYKNGF